MKQQIEIETWERRENYLFFREFANPYYTVTAQVDVTRAYARAKEAGIRFSHFTIYASLRAANAVEALRYRQIDGRVWLFDRIRLNTPVALPDGSFVSVVVPCTDTLHQFVEAMQDAIRRATAGEGDAYGADTQKDTFVISVNPWYSFTGMQFQFPKNAGENIPLSVFGKMELTGGGRRTMPVAVSFHHGFADGRHVGRYWELFQQHLDTL